MSRSKWKISYIKQTKLVSKAPDYVIENVDKKLKTILTRTRFDKTLFQQIEKILPHSDRFRKCSYVARLKISTKIDKIFISKNKKDIFNNTAVIPICFENEFLKFKSEFQTSLNTKIPRVNSALFVNQLTIYIKHLIFKFKKEGVKGLQKITTRKILKKIKADVFFDKVLLQPFSSSSYNDILFGDKKWVWKEQEKVLWSFNLVKRIASKLLLHLSYLILEKSRFLYPKMKEIFEKSSSILDEKKSENFFHSVPCQLSEMFFNCLELKRHIHFNPKAQKSFVYFRGTFKGITKFARRNFFPEIVPIENFSENEADNIFTQADKLKKGMYLKRTLHKKTKKALEVAQTKKFKINENTLKIFEHLDSMDSSCFENIKLLPFVPKSVLKKMMIEVENLKSKFEPKDAQKIKKFWQNQKNKKFENENWLETIILDTGLNSETISLIQEWFHKNKKLEQYILLRREHNTIIKTAKIYCGYPIFFKEILDYRGRMYAEGHGINRNSGIYKYLLQDFTEKTLQKNGLYILLKAFYKDFPEKNKKLSGLRNKSINQLLNWNDKHIKMEVKTILKSKSPIYKLSLFYELKKITNQKLKTGVLIEIDQRNSSSVFAAILLGDTNLASLCNLDSKINNDLGSFVMLKSKNWYKGKINENSLKILTTNRKIHKKFVMCFYFGQTYFGRRQELKKYFSIFKDIGIISKTYNNFLNEIFPDLVTKINLLKSFVSYFLEKTNSDVTIKTLDHSKFSWSFFSPTKNYQSNSYMSVSKGKHLTYKRKAFDINKLNIRKMCLGFLACYIHSLDAAVMRLFILEVEKKCNYIISHLHDSLQFHPNYYDDILKCIKKVYTSEFLKKVMDKTLINVMKPLLKKNDQAGFESLVQKFKFQSNNIQIKNKSFKVKTMYRL